MITMMELRPRCFSQIRAETSDCTQALGEIRTNVSG